MSDGCVTCGRSLGATCYVIEGMIGTYVECEWCYAGTDRPPEPELITDTFKTPYSLDYGSATAGRLDRIVDKLTGTSGEHAERAYADERERLDAR